MNTETMTEANNITGTLDPDKVGGILPILRAVAASRDVNLRGVRYSQDALVIMDLGEIRVVATDAVTLAQGVIGACDHERDIQDIVVDSESLIHALHTNRSAPIRLVEAGGALMIGETRIPSTDVTFPNWRMIWPKSSYSQTFEVRDVKEFRATLMAHKKAAKEAHKASKVAHKARVLETREMMKDEARIDQTIQSHRTCSFERSKPVKSPERREWAKRRNGSIIRDEPRTLLTLTERVLRIETRTTEPGADPVAVSELQDGIFMMDSGSELPKPIRYSLYRLLPLIPRWGRMTMQPISSTYPVLITTEHYEAVIMPITF